MNDQEAVRKIEDESFVGRIEAIWREIVATLRRVWRALVPVLKRAFRWIVATHLQHEDPQIRTVAQIWLRSKNRRIRKKQLKRLFPSVGW